MVDPKQSPISFGPYSINLQRGSVNCFPEDNSGPERLSTMAKGRDQLAGLGLEPSSTHSGACSPSSWLRGGSPDIQRRLQRRMLEAHLLLLGALGL